VQLSPERNEREFREMLTQKISGTSAGLWLLVPEYLRLGTWDILKAWTGKTASDSDLDPRVAMQLVNESALCIPRVRKKNSLNHQGFQLSNGMGRLVTDEQVHLLLNSHSMEDAQQMLVNLGIQRQLSGHYPGGLIAIDPHRIVSASKRIMVKKKKVPSLPSQKMIQTFFCVDAQSGQPIMFTMSSSGMPTTMATKQLLNLTGRIVRDKSLLVADKEHFTQELLSYAKESSRFDLLTPVLNTGKLKKLLQHLEYTRLWAGFAMTESEYTFNNCKKPFRLLAQRTGERQEDYCYHAFITTSEKSAQTLITEQYDERWTVEKFFNFENKMGLDRAATHNLNIRYGRLAMSMLAQAACFQLRKNLKNDYLKWDAEHLAREVLAYAEGDVKVKDDTIVVTFYGSTNHIIKEKYENLPDILMKERIDPKIPWLYDFKLDFRFK